MKGIPFFILIIGSYIGAFIASLVIKDDDSDDSINVSNILLYGTVGWIVAFLFGAFGIMNILELVMMLRFVMFILFGMVSYMVFTLLDNSRG